MKNLSRNIRWSTRPNRRMELIYRTGPLSAQRSKRWLTIAMVDSL
jgi:hypothetical protein